MFYELIKQLSKPKIHLFRLILILAGNWRDLFATNFLVPKLLKT